MDNLTKFILILIGTGLFCWLVVFIVEGFNELGGRFHGKWLVRQDREHDCKTPSVLDATNGDRWQCYKCKTISVKQGFGWKAER